MSERSTSELRPAPLLPVHVFQIKNQTSGTLKVEVKVDARTKLRVVL